MTLAAGTRLGQFEVLSELGSGAMGVVYRARDTRLEREIALKVLPPSFAREPERLARFEREAKLLAQLNHPNIASLYGVVDAEGAPALVLELVEGSTLGERIAAGPLPVDEALSIARQVAEALEAAHERGVIHRDLKPDNIKITGAGQVKVLDFGLAKAIEGSLGSGGTAGLADSPTLTQGATQLGMILGTAGYMAPEQARGRPADRRSDIWAFGVVATEMLTGRRLFAGETVSETLAEVLKSSIDWSALPANTPPALRRLLRRTLERDPRNRLHDIADARIVLDEILGGRAEEGTAVVAAPPARRLPSWSVVAALAAALVAGGLVGWALRRPAPPVVPAQRWALAMPEGVRLTAGAAGQLALSRDGRRQAVVVEDVSGTTRLLVRRDDELEARLVPDSERAAAPFFSPDGDWIGFFRDLEMVKVQFSGGPPVRLAAAGRNPRGASWSVEGLIYFSPDNVGPIVRVSANGGPVEAVSRLAEDRLERTHRFPEVLPSGRALLFTVDTHVSPEIYDDARIEALELASGARKVLVEGASQAWVLAHGRRIYLVFARGGDLLAAPFDPDSLTVLGDALPVVSGVSTFVGTGWVRFAHSDSGAALWAPGRAPDTNPAPVWLDRAGSAAPTPIEPGTYQQIALSPDGKRAAVVRQQGAAADLWVADLERGAMTRLTVGELISVPTWAPDGSRVAYATRAQGGVHGAPWRIAWRAADGSREAETLVESERPQEPSSFTPDGSALVFERLGATATERNIWLLPLRGRREPRPILEGPFWKGMAEVSPDGRFLAYASDESGRYAVYVRPFGQDAGKWPITPTQGMEPHWSADGREIFYRDGGTLFRVAVRTAGAFDVGVPERLFPRVTTGPSSRTYSPAPDGRRFLVRPFDPTPPANKLFFDLGFAANVARLVPSGRD